MTICSYDARSVASEAFIEDLKMEAGKTKYDVMGLTQTRRHLSLHVVYDSGEEMFVGNCFSRKLGSVDVIVNTLLTMDIVSSLTSRIEGLRQTECGCLLALTVVITSVPTSDYDDGEAETFCVGQG